MAVAEIERILCSFSITWCDKSRNFIDIRKYSFTRNQQWKNSALDDIFDVLLCNGQNPGDLVDDGIELLQIAIYLWRYRLMRETVGT